MSYLEKRFEGDTDCYILMLLIINKRSLEKQEYQYNRWLVSLEKNETVFSKRAWCVYFENDPNRPQRALHRLEHVYKVIRTKRSKHFTIIEQVDPLNEPQLEPQLKKRKKPQKPVIATKPKESDPLNEPQLEPQLSSIDWLREWLNTVGTNIRSNPELNQQTAEKMATELGEDYLKEVLQAVRVIRADKYAPRNVQIPLINFIGLKKKLEEVEAYMAGMVDHKVTTSVREFTSRK